MGKKNKGREDEKCYTSKDLKEESRKKGFRMPELGLSKRIFIHTDHSFRWIVTYECSDKGYDK